MQANTYQLLLTSKIGDGCCHISTGSVNARIVYMGVQKDYIKFKRNILAQEYACNEVKYRKKPTKFNKDGFLYELYTKTHINITQVYYLSKLEVIDRLDMFGLFIYYLDDGTYNISSNTCRFCCYSFTLEDAKALMSKIIDIFCIPIEDCKIIFDKNKHNSPNVYVNKRGTKLIVNSCIDFMHHEPLLWSMLYKLGVTPPQTIEKN